jgi:hypothetical protein
MLEPVTSSPHIRKQLEMVDFPRTGDGIQARPQESDRLILSKRPEPPKVNAAPPAKKRWSVPKLLGGLVIAGLGLAGAAALVTGAWATAPFWAGWAMMGIIGGGTYIASKGAAELGKKWREQREAKPYD